MKTSAMLAKLNVKGEKFATQGVEFGDSGRIPTGSFVFNLASGGGFLEGRVNVIWGSESSCKTTLSLSAVAQFQRMHPGKRVYWFDLEKAFQPSWATRLGVDVKHENFIYLPPTYAEKVVDNILLVYEEDPDAGMVVVDSMAMLSKKNEAEDTAEKANVGGSGGVLSKFSRMLAIKYGTIDINDRYAPTLLLINQTRTNVNARFNKNTQPGGWAFLFASSFTARVWGKDKMDDKIHPTLPAWKEITGTIEKDRCDITAKNFELWMATANSKHYRTGQFREWPVIKEEAKALDILVQIKGGWSLMGDEFKTQAQAEKAFESDPEKFDRLKRSIIEARLARLEQGDNFQ